MALTSNALIAYNDFVQSGTVYSNNTPMDENYPLENAMLPDLWRPAVFAPTSTGIITFVIDLQAVKALGLISLLKHNINYTGKWRIQLNADIADPVGQEYDSGWVTVIPKQTSFGALQWGQFMWGDTIPEYNLGRYNRHAYMPLPTTIIARYITVSIDAPSNTDFPRFFRLWASLAYQPSTNVQYGADITPIDETKVVTAVSGTRQYGPPVQRRQVNFGWDFLPRTEMLYNIVGGLYLASGTFTPVIVLLEPTDPANFYTEAVYGNMMTLDKASYVAWMQWATTLKVEEQV